MKGKRYRTEQKIRIVREGQRSDRQIADVCRDHQISEQSYPRWKAELGMLEVDQAKQLKELRRANERLKRMLADEMLGKELLKEALEKKWCAPAISVRSSRRLWTEGVVRPARPAVTSGFIEARSAMWPSSPTRGWRS